MPREHYHYESQQIDQQTESRVPWRRHGVLITPAGALIGQCAAERTRHLVDDNRVCESARSPPAQANSAPLAQASRLTNSGVTSPEINSCGALIWRLRFASTTCTLSPTP
jgi:hypothetical protein